MQRKTAKKTVIVGMSGGVDSSVAAALLKKQGYLVIGVYMKNWSDNFGDYGCTWAADVEDARKVAQVLDIPFYVWNFEKEYYAKVVEYFLKEYANNRTPNPDILCNSEIKFKLFLEKALSLGADYVATGHYAVVKANENNEKSLYKGVDPGKDQSYFLYRLSSNQLSKVMFPLGTYQKTEVRELARKFNLPTAEKKDSQGICFIGKIDVRKFLMEKLKSKRGQIVTTTGQVIGTHEGLPYYTIGQREGIGLGGNGPFYVVEKNIAANELMVTNNKSDSKLWKKNFIVGDLSWVNGEPKFPLTTGVSIRYHHPEYTALVEKNEDKLLIKFRNPQRAITEGQSAVIYDHDRILGGGIIEKVLE